jgi:hypothetical protein
MGRHLAAVLVSGSHSDERSNIAAVIMFDRVGAHFTFARGVYAAPEDETITDIDMSGRRLIVGGCTNRFGRGGVNNGRVNVLEFEPSPAPISETDREEADESESEADEP